MSAASRPRFLPEVPLPPYSFVPGRSPHPFSDPAGHHFGTPPEQPPALDPRRWQDSRAYLRGLDLFNHGYYWEAHEAWEGLWHAAGRRGATADFLKALIRLAAAGVKHREGTSRGVKSHARRAAELWRRVADSLSAGEEAFLGLRLRELIERAAAIDERGWPEEPPLLLPSFEDSPVNGQALAHAYRQPSGSESLPGANEC